MRILVAGALALALIVAGGAARPYYGGGKHTESHGGTYRGGQGGSAHKGRTYRSPTGSHSYGKHK